MGRYPNATNCVVCGKPLRSNYQDEGKDAYIFNCSACPPFRLLGGQNPSATIDQLSKPDRSRLIRAVRGTVGLRPITIRPEEVRHLVESVRIVPPTERRRNLLTLLSDKTLSPNQPVMLGDIADLWIDLGFVADDEFAFWLQALQDAQLIQMKNLEIRLTHKGLLECDQIASARRDMKQVFVAMAFGATPDQEAEWRRVYDVGLRPGIEGSLPDPTGLFAKRIDLVHTNGKICDEIIVEIRRSRAMVAEVSSQRPNVYYEAGFAHGLGIPVVFACKADMWNLHFDTRQYQTIKWNQPEDLASQLEARIKATIVPA